MALCFIEPSEAIRVVMDSVGRPARDRLATVLIQAWVDEIPNGDLDRVYAEAVNGLDMDDLALLAAWHASLDVGDPVASREYLLDTFAALGEYKRQAVQLAVGFHGDNDLRSPVGRQALASVVPTLNGEQADLLTATAVESYMEDRLGSLN